MITLDDVDRQLIALLRDNARLPVVALAKELRVARATVQNRLTRLEKNGVIVGYTVRLAGGRTAPDPRADVDRRAGQSRRGSGEGAARASERRVDP